MKYVVNIKKEEHPKMTTSNIIVLVAFAFYMLVMIAIGVVYSKKTKNAAGLRRFPHRPPI